MKYQEYIIYPPAEELSPLVEELSALGLDQLIIEDPKDAELFTGDPDSYLWSYVEQGLLDAVREHPSVSFYLAEGESLPEGAEELLRRYDCRKSLADDEDWLHKWEEYYVPIRLSPHIVAKPVWRDYEPREGDMVIEIDPGLAFGTGTSPTTYLAVRLMEKYLKSGTDVLDVGCGTGILSCAAVKLGASKVTAVDLDPEAVLSTGVNVRLNGCEDKVEVFRSDLLNDTDAVCDALIANLTGPLVIRLCPDAAPHCRPGALFISSGIIDDKEEACVKAIEEAGFDVIDIERDGGWSAVAALLRH
ncbi:MAG: 50S ribosomal protein L11 methyltransferase [Firmicutes bacterium]|nr:50S ribosomal protein L11 methyltransferase [Bacillota bacterium]